MKTKIPTAKPSDMSINLAYRCPKCSTQHWTSSQSAKIKRFIIVCDCECVFKPKLIKNISIEYNIKKQNNRKNHRIPETTLNQSVSILTGYGYTKEEAIDLINSVYDKDQPTTVATLIKLALKNIGDI